MSNMTANGFRVGLLGEGISESLTPAMHVGEGRNLGLAYAYELFDIAAETFDAEGLAAFVRGLQAAGFAGLNVTHPYKQQVIPMLDALSHEAKTIGAVNLIVFGDAGLVGHNTDWTGFAGSLTDQLGSPIVGTVLQLGSGGAGAATAYALLHLGAPRVVIHDLDPARSAGLAERYAPLFPDQVVTSTNGETADLWGGLSGVVHATPTGMERHPGIPFDPDALPADAWVAEIVYRPLETELVRAARAAGLQVIDGSMMAAGQAIDSLRILTGLEPDAERVRAELVSLLREEGTPAAAAAD